MYSSLSVSADLSVLVYEVVPHKLLLSDFLTKLAIVCFKLFHFEIICFRFVFYHAFLLDAFFFHLPPVPVRYMQ